MDLHDLVPCIRVGIHEEATIYASRRTAIPRPTAYGVILDRTNLLTIKTRFNGRRSMPGGALEKGESYSDALAREIWEETRMTVTTLRSWRDYSVFVRYEDEDDVFHLLIKVYLCEVDDLDQTLSDGNNPSPREGPPTWSNLLTTEPQEYLHIHKQIAADIKAEFCP